MISVIVLGIVLVLIMLRTFFSKFKLEIWQIMAFGALAVLITLQITPLNALKAIDWNVIVFLTCMFILGEAIEESRLLESISYKLFKNTHNESVLLLVFIVAMGVFSMLFTNDTVAIIGTTLCFMLAKYTKIPIKCLLLTLAFSVTSISLLSPFGSPQNLLIASSAVFNNAFISFFVMQIIPTVLSVGVLFLFMKLCYKTSSQNPIQELDQPVIENQKLYKLCKVSVLIVILGIVVKIVVREFAPSYDFALMWIAVAGALPIVIFGNARKKVISNIDWRTLVFFVSMFILMKSVWNSSFTQDLLTKLPLGLTDTSVIYLIGLLLSQLISNVPLVTLYLPILETTDASILSYIALVSGSTLAGNLSILGAASNVIVIQQAENRGVTISFWEFFKIGFPLCLVQSAIYIIYFLLLS